MDKTKLNIIKNIYLNYHQEILLIKQSMENVIHITNGRIKKQGNNETEL